MTSTQKGMEGEGKKCNKFADIQYCRRDFADREGGGGPKIPKLCGCHIWQPP